MTATPGPEIVDLARCAEIAAHLAHFPAQHHAEIAARFGLRWHEWEAASARWTAARDAELAAGPSPLSSRFVRAFVAAAERLQAQPASLESIGPLPHALRVEAAPPAPPPLLDRAEGEPPAVEVPWTPAGAEDLGAPSFWAQGAAPGAPPASRLLAATAAVSGVAAPAMPFAPAPGAPGGALDRALAHADAVQGSRAPLPSGGATVAAPEPAGGHRSPGAGELTVEQYTSLRVELHLLPDRAAAILARYGIRPDEREALFARWRSRFEADPPLRMWFARGYAQYLAWVRENPGALEGFAQRSAGGT